MNVLGARACKADRNLLVDPIRASSLYRLHKQAGQTTAPDQRPVHHFMLATREPSTEDFQARQQDEPILISMGMAEQRAWALS